MNIIILHGWMQSKEALQGLEKQLAALPHVKSVTAIDLPGFGTEVKPDSDWGIPEYAAWVTEKIETGKKSNIVLVGHSFGGRIASYIASQRPSWLTALILSGTPALYRPSAKMKLKLKFFKRIKKLAPAKAKQLFYSDELHTAEQAGMGAIFRNVVTFDQTDFIKNIQVPTFLIWGAEDDSVPVDQAREIHRLIPNSELVVIDKGSHNSFISHPYLFLGHVKKFIESL